MTSPWSTVRGSRNLLLITTDQERWFHDDPVPLPAHARLRAAGTSFDRFYAASIACSSARSVIYTGQHVQRTGVIDNVGLPGQPSMRSDLPTLGTVLRDAGYVTAYKGKWHLSTEALLAQKTGAIEAALEPYGFGDYSEAGDDLGLPYDGFRRDAAIAEEAARWLATTGAAANAEGVAWCLVVSLINPHDIMFGSSDQARLTRNRSLPPERGAYVGPPDTDLYRPAWDLDDDPSWLDQLDGPNRIEAHREFAVANKMFTGEAADDIDGLRHFRDYYMNCLRDVDNAVGTVLDALDACAFADRTVVAYTSDHGELAGAHGLFGKGPCVYDENLRLPLLVVDPGRPGGSRSDALGSQVDLLPTLVEAATGSDTAAPQGLPGRSLLSRSSPGSERSAALFSYDGLLFVDGEWAYRTFAGMRTDDQVTGRDLTNRGLMRSLITKTHKFSRYFAPGEHHRPRSVEELFARNTVELFDLEADPGEVVNLAVDPSPATLGLIGELDAALSALIEDEIGVDDGGALPAFPGAPWMS